MNQSLCLGFDVNSVCSIVDGARVCSTPSMPEMCLAAMVVPSGDGLIYSTQTDSQGQQHLCIENVNTNQLVGGNASCLLSTSEAARNLGISFLPVAPAPDNKPLMTNMCSIGFVPIMDQGYLRCTAVRDPEATNGAATNGAATNGAATNGAATNGAATNGAATNGAATNGAATNGAATNGAATNGAANGAATNGAATNGAATNGAATNGAATNGAATNGAATNGAATNGAATNGAATNGAATNGAATNGAATNGAAPAATNGVGPVNEVSGPIYRDTPFRRTATEDEAEMFIRQQEARGQSMAAEVQPAAPARRTLPPSLSPENDTVGGTTGSSPVRRVVISEDSVIAPPFCSSLSSIEDRIRCIQTTLNTTGSAAFL
jgi:hypothetical protein